jgi:serine/threonine protein phosphatase 1
MKALAVKRRRFAVGDVHGCLRTLRTLVERQIDLKRHDTLYLVGDYLDRGPHSKGVLDYLMTLMEGGYDLRPLLGNHEEMALQAVADPKARAMWYANRGSATVAEFGVESPADIPARYLAFLASLPLILSCDDYVFVHAGLDFSAPDPLRDSPPTVMLWERNCEVQAEKLGGRTLVCGHTVTSLAQIRASLAKPVICLDNGCFAKEQPGWGNLVALDLDHRELLVQKNCD